jgi:hypothetical protein
MKRAFFAMVVMLCFSMSVGAVELNSLNTIEYAQGQTIELSTKVLDGAIAVSDVQCQTYVLKNTDNSEILGVSNMTYNEATEQHEYSWVPELTWWENIEQIWNPAVGNYHAYVLCTGGELGARTLVDQIAVVVTE